MSNRPDYHQQPQQQHHFYGQQQAYHGAEPMQDVRGHLGMQSYRQTAQQQMVQAGYAAQNTVAQTTTWPHNLPGHLQPAPLSFPAYQQTQQSTLMQLPPAQGYPAAAAIPGWPYSNYPSGAAAPHILQHTAHQYAATQPQQMLQQPPLQQQQPQPQQQQQQQPNPAYAQRFVPHQYSQGTRPQTGLTHSQAQFHPQMQMMQAQQQQYISHMPQPGIEPQLQQPPMLQPQIVLQQPQSQQPRPPKGSFRLAIVNPDTKEEVHVESVAAARTAADPAAAALSPPTSAPIGARPRQGVPIEKPPASDSGQLQKDLLMLRATAHIGKPPQQPAPTAAAQPSSATSDTAAAASDATPTASDATPAATASDTNPAATASDATPAATATASAAINATVVAKPETPPATAISAAISIPPATSYPPAKPVTPLPSPAQETETQQPLLLAVILPTPAAPKAELTVATVQTPDQEAAPTQQTTEPPKAAAAPKTPTPPVATPPPVPVNGEAANSGHQSSSPQVASREASTAGPASRKSSTDAGVSASERPVPASRAAGAAPLKYEFKPEPGESDLKTLEKKLRYDRDFLLSLRNSNLSSQRPDELPGDIPELLPRADSQQSQIKNIGRGFDFTPSYVQPVYKDKVKPPAAYGGAPHRGGGGGGGGRAGPPPKPVVKPLVIEVRKDKVDLHKTEQAYVPGFLQKKPDDLDQAKKAEIERNIRLILNKIAPQNFESCFNQLTTTCDIGSIGGLNACVDIIFEKATREKSYSSVFAEICKRLAFLKVNMPEQQPQDSNKQFVGFRSLLLKKCQEMFETPLKEQMEQKGAEWDEKIAKEEKEDRKKAMEEERDEQVKKVKDQYYGNIRFIGELFMKDILTANIIHQCIVSQLKSDHNSKSMFTESLECLCELLKTVGKKLESENNAKTRIEQYFDRIKKLIKNQEIESKVRFRLQDIVEMRQRNWERREMEIRLHERPMTKEELELKARQEEEKKQQQMVSMQQGGRSGRPGGFSRPPAGPPAVAATAGSEWTAVPATRKAQKMDVRKMVIEGRGVEQGPQTRLGPQRPSFGKARPGKEEGRATPTTGSRFGSQKNSRESSASRGTSRESSPHVDPQKMPRSQSTQELPARAVDAAPLMSRDMLERKSKNIMMEWLGSLCSLEDTKTSFMEISQHPEIKAFVETNADHLLNEKSKELRERGGQLLFELLHSGLLSSKDLIDGFSPMMEMAEDFLSDFPHLASYLGEILSSLVQKAASYLLCVQQLLLQIPADLRDSSRRSLRGEILSRALHLASVRLGHDRVGSAFREAGIVWSRVLEMSESEAEQFVSVSQVEFTLHKTAASLAPAALDKIGDRIKQQIVSAAGNKTASDQLSEHLIALIENEVAKEQLEKQEFYRTLARSVCQGCTCNKKFDKSLFHAVKPVLQRYVDNEEHRQWILNATCDAVQSAGLPLKLMSDLLFAYLDGSIVCEDSCKQWCMGASNELLNATQTFFSTLESTHSSPVDDDT